MLDFIKKYPMSILLGIIAINLFNISGSLKIQSELTQQKLFCLMYDYGEMGMKESNYKYKPNAQSISNYCNAVEKI